MNEPDIARKRTYAFRAQDAGKEAREQHDYMTAAGHYRTAAEIWLSLGEMDQYERCLATADDLGKEI